MTKSYGISRGSFVPSGSLRTENWSSRKFFWRFRRATVMPWGAVRQKGIIPFSGQHPTPSDPSSSSGRGEAFAGKERWLRHVPAAFWITTQLRGRPDINKRRVAHQRVDNDVTSDFSGEHLEWFPDQVVVFTFCHCSIKITFVFLYLHTVSVHALFSVSAQLSWFLIFEHYVKIDPSLDQSEFGPW